MRGGEIQFAKKEFAFSLIGDFEGIIIRKMGLRSKVSLVEVWVIREFEAY